MNKKLVHGDLEATTKQTFMIFRLGGGDVRDRNLSRKEASDMIEMLLAAKGQQKAAEASGTPSYADIWAEATEAANKAGDD